jgi:hypothetical protein
MTMTLAAGHSDRALAALWIAMAIDPHDRRDGCSRTR